MPQKSTKAVNAHATNLPDRDSVRHAILDPKKFLDTYDRILGDVDIRLTLQHATEVATEVLDAERASVFRFLEETNELQTVVTTGNVARAIRVPVNPRSLAGYCAQYRRAFIIDDAYGDLSSIDPHIQFDRSWDAINGFRTRSMLCVPVVFQDNLLGVAQVINSRSGLFNESDLETLRNIARFIGYALHYGGLYEELSTLKKLDKEKAEFMRIMVHELKSPVATSKTLADAVLMHENEETPSARALKRINARLDELLSLIADIMDLSRIKSGSPMGDIAVCDLAEVFTEMSAKYKEQSESKNLRMTTSIPSVPVPIMIDSKGLQLVISNLLSNAVKYTQAGSVQATVLAENGKAVLTVSDTGIGIPRNDLPKLFTEFYRASNARRQRIQGTGVGLAGIRDIVERFGGSIEIESQEGVGSTFTIRLPLVTPLAPATT